MNSEWQWLKLGEVADVFTGFPFKSSGYLPAGAGIRVVRGDNVTEHSLRWAEKEKCWEGVSGDLKPYLLRAGDVVIGMDGSKVGKNFASVSEADGPCLLAQRVARVRGSNRLDQTYLRYLICNKRFTEYVRSVHTGTSIPHISKRQIEEFKVPLPPLPLQNVIGSLLKSLDDRLALLREANATLEAIALSIFKSWFIDLEPVRAKVEGREPEGIDQDTAALFPDSMTEWAQYCRRVRASELLACKILMLGDGYRAKNSELGSPGIAFVRAGDLLQGRITPTEDTLSMSALAKANNKMANAGDTAFTSKGTIGRFAYVDESAGEAVYSPQVCFWRSLDREQLQPVFLHFWMKSPLFSAQVDLVRGQAAIMDFVSLSDQRRMFIDLPSPPIQQRFSEHVQPILNRISANRATASILGDLRDTLLPRLLSGQLRLPDAETMLKDAA